MQCPKQSTQEDIIMDLLFQSSDISVRRMTYADIPAICEAYDHKSDNDAAYLNRQLANQDKQECSALLALYHENVAGYVLLYYRCRWGGLANCNLPSVVDLIVFKDYRQKKIATVLMDVAENIAKKHCDKVYLDVCLNAEYGPAQRLYTKRGYIPDGKGIYYEGKVCETDADCKNNDELALCLVKNL